MSQFRGETKDPDMIPKKLVLLTIASTAVLAGGPWARSQSTPTPVLPPPGFSMIGGAFTVEEEWELTVPTPNPDGDGPQVMTYMSLAPDTSESYFWFMVNVRDAPGPYSPGGMQVQVWNFSDRLLGASSYGSAEISKPNAVIRWRQRMTNPQFAGGIVTYEICDGTSPTWGNFGTHYAGGTLTTYPGPAVVSFTTSVKENLQDYNPNISVQMSRVGWQPNNVGRLRLVAVRQYDKQGKEMRVFTMNKDVSLAK